MLRETMIRDNNERVWLHSMTRDNDNNEREWLNTMTREIMIRDTMIRETCLLPSRVCARSGSRWGVCVTFMTWLISYVWPDSFIGVTWRIHICDMTLWYVSHDSCICVTWLIYVCAVTHLNVWHVAPTRMSHVAHTSECHDSFICVPWIINMCAMTHSYVWHDTHENESCHTHGWVMSHT